MICVLQVKEGYRKYGRLGRCMGHSGHVTHLDWSTDSHFLQSNSLEVQEVLYWSAGVCRPLRDVATIRDIEWATHDCPISWLSLGVWGEPGPDSPDVLSVAQSTDPDRPELLAAGDAAGRLMLYGSPAGQPKSLHHTYQGHSGPVTRVAWLEDSSKLVSTGGRDTAILQWNTV